MEQTITSARQLALDLLKPTPAQLDHGLKLHADALVVESYGFAPRAAIDGDAVRKLVESAASPQEVRQVVEDMSMTRMASDPVQRKWFVEAFDAAGVTCIMQNAGEEGQSVKCLLRRLARFTHTTDAMPDVLARVARPDDIPAAKAAGKHCLCLTGNGVPLAEEWLSREEELVWIRIFRQLGIRMMHLTYNRRNMIGDGCGETADAGLSDFGRAAIAEMNRQGVIIDVAHSGWRTSLEAARASTRPMMASHTTCAALHHHPRGKPDDVLRAVADTGGCVGICCIPGFLGLTGDIRTFLDHLDYAVKLIGPDHVAIGTDCAYSPPDCNTEGAKVPFAKRRSGWENYWPEHLRYNAPQWSNPDLARSMAWTNWPLFTVGLVQRGHSDDAIRKIIGGNVLRVLCAATG